MKNLILCLLPLLISLNSSASITEIYDTKTKTTISLSELVKLLPGQAQFILGEYHNTPEIQQAQAIFISEKVIYENAQTRSSVFWEFLNYTDQDKINREMISLKSDLMNTTEFITKTAGKHNLSYAPIINAVKALNIDLYGINLPRKIKQEVMKGGINSVDPSYIPRNHYVGGELYRERFLAAMGGHVPAEKVDKYFLAQCLTDSVMAEKISSNDQHLLNFTIAGSFHTDFF